MQNIRKVYTSADVLSKAADGISTTNKELAFCLIGKNNGSTCNVNEIKEYKHTINRTDSVEITQESVNTMQKHISQSNNGKYIGGSHNHLEKHNHADELSSQDINHIKENTGGKIHLLFYAKEDGGVKVSAFNDGGNGGNPTQIPIEVENTQGKIVNLFDGGLEINPHTGDIPDSQKADYQKFRNENQQNNLQIAA